MANLPIRFLVNKKMLYKALDSDEFTVNIANRAVSARVNILKRVKTKFYIEGLEDAFDNDFINTDGKALSKKLNSKGEIILLTHGDIHALLCLLLDENQNSSQNHQFHRKDFEMFVDSYSIDTSYPSSKYIKHFNSLSLFIKNVPLPSYLSNYYLTVSKKDYKIKIERRSTFSLKNKLKTSSKTPKNAVKSNSITYDDISVFMAIGDYPSAINLIKKGNDFNNLPLSKKIKILEIEQKFGLFKEPIDIFKTLNISVNEINKEQTGLIKLIELKMFSQVNSPQKVVTLFKEVDKALDGTNSKIRICSAHLRTAIAYGKLGEKKDCELQFKFADFFAEKKKENRLLTIVNMYKTLSSFFLGFPELENEFDNIVDCQFSFIENTTNLHHEIKGQSSRHSGVTLCLFIEASMYLRNGDLAQAKIRLLAANTLGYYSRCGMKSEGFAELLSLLKPSEYEYKIVSAAMNSRDSKRLEFQNNLGDIGRYLSDIQESIYNFYYTPNKANLNALHEIFRTYA